MLPKLSIPQRVLCISKSDQRLTMARRYLEQIEIVDSFEAIPWSDILLRRVRLIAVPGKTEARTTEARLKRTLIKYLGLSISGLLGKVNFEDCLLNDYGPKVLFAPANAVVNIYAHHLTDFSILELKDELHSHRMRKIAQKADRAEELGLKDDKPGLTVFTNVRNDTILRAYKKFHPNRRIVLRYHDRLHAGLGKRAPDRASLLQMIRKLHDDGVVESIESYYRRDAEIMGGLYRPNGVNPAVLSVLPRDCRNALYRFIGGPRDVGDHSRIEVLKEIKTELLRLYPNAASFIDERFILSPADWVPYPEYLKETALSEIVVDITRIGQEEGFSFRIPEALFLNRKIISNRTILRDEPFYSPERIFLIGIDPIERLQSFLDADIDPLPEEVLRLYDSRLWWTDDDPVKAKETVKEVRA